MRLLGWLALIGIVGLAAFASMLALLGRYTNVGSTSTDRHYVVQPGDTLSGIADRHRTTVATLVAANKLADANQIEVGQRLRVSGVARSARAPRTSRDRPTRVEPTQAEVDRQVGRYMAFMECSAGVRAFTRPLAQRECFDIGANLHEWAALNRRYTVMADVSDRMKALGWWGWAGPKYRLVR